jgi:hypothetical protein
MNRSLDLRNSHWIIETSLDQVASSMNLQAQVDGTLHPGACQNLRGVTYLDNAIMNDQQGGERCERVENIERAREIARCGHSTGPILAWRQLRGPVVPWSQFVSHKQFVN